jgi:hypothetical protein
MTFKFYINTNIIVGIIFLRFFKRFLSNIAIKKIGLTEETLLYDYINWNF